MNDFDVNVDRLVSKFQDENKIAEAMDCGRVCKSIEWDTDQLQKRMEK